MKKPVKIFFGILCVVFVCIFAYSAYRLYGIMHEYHVSDEMNKDIRSQFVTSVTALNQSAANPSANAASTEQSPISVDFDALLEQCADVVGWIYCEDTRINYPVAQSTDNDYYLHRFLDGSYSGSGTIFLDWICPGDFSGRHSILYGHNMNDGSMFAGIRKYTDQSYYDEHPVMYLNTPTQDYRIDLFSGYVTGALDNTTYNIGFVDDADFQAFLDQASSRSNFRSDVEVTAQDHVITLSTCTYEYDNARYVLVGKLVPLGGQTVEAQVNETPAG